MPFGSMSRPISSQPDRQSFLKILKGLFWKKSLKRVQGRACKKEEYT